MSIREDDNLDDYLGAEGDVVAVGIGLHWLKGDRLVLLHDRLREMDTTSARTWLGVLDLLAEASTAEHVEMARMLRCSPEQLRARNGKMTGLLRDEFTGYGWPFGWRHGRPDAGEAKGTTVYEMHPRVAECWRAARACPR